MFFVTVTGLDLSLIHARYESVLKILKKENCSLSKAMESYGVARNTLRDFIGICELRIIDGKRYKTIMTMERDRSGKPAVKTIEMRCRAALAEYKAQVKTYKEAGRLLPFFPSESFYTE